MKQTNILIAEEHTLIRQSLTMILEANPKFSVVSQTTHAMETLHAAKMFQPHIVIFNVNIPGSPTQELIAKIKAVVPDVHVICLSAFTQPACTRSMLKAGASGYVTWNSGATELVHSIEEVIGGKKYICDEVKDHLAGQVFSSYNEQEEPGTLSKRELDIVQYLRNGWSSKEIAGTTCLSQKTIEGHRYNILKKLKLKNVAALVNYVNQNQLLVEMPNDVAYAS